MKDEDKTKSQLINELVKMRQRVTELEASERERKRTEQALRESEEKFRSLAEKSLVGVYLIQNGIFKYINPRLAEIFGYTVEELINKKGPKDLVLPEDWPMVEENLRKRISGEVKSIHYDFRGITKDKEVIYVEVYGSRTIYQGQPAVIGTLLDITERKRAEEEREKLYAQLLQAQKMEAIGTLAGGVAHDFNNLLTLIHGYTDLAMMKIDEADPLYRNLKQIRLAAVRATNLIRQLLLFSRKQPMEFSLLNLNRTVDDLLKMIKRLIGEDITINTELEPNLWTVQADTGSIEQVIMNLAVNARDAMPKGGRLTIKTENVILDKKQCKVIPEARPGKFICLSVEDTGIGMDKKVIQHIFEPFFSTKDAGKGTGLGLSVVYGIIKQHGGWINVYSEPGQGSIFKIYLPAFSIKPEEETKEMISLHELQGGGQRILLVEDEEEVRRFAANFLSENGYVVFEAANVKEAMEVFEREEGKFHLIFCDVVLPDQSGLQLIERLLSYKSELRVLLTSGYTDDKSQWPIICERKFRFLQKPYALAELLQAIKEAITN